MKVNKRIFKVIICFLFFFAIINVYGEPLAETNNRYQVIIEDDADLLTAEEETKLKDKMYKLSEYGNIIFKSINENNTTTESYARNYYHENFSTESGSVFLIDMHNRNIYIFSDGANYNTITNSKALIITDNVYQYATNQEYYTCAEEAFSQMESLLAGQKIAEPMRHTSNAVIAIVLAFFINFFIVLGASRIKKAEQSEIIKNCAISFSVSNIVGNLVGTHSVYSPISDSGGSSGGGGGGGGGSSGGGGGHSF